MKEHRAGLQPLSRAILPTPGAPGCILRPSGRQNADTRLSHVKRRLSDADYSVDPFNFSRYSDEQRFRYKTGKAGEHKITDAERFQSALGQINGKRLT